MMSERLQKLISRAGLTSRREAEKWIVEGKVLLNGQPARLGDCADLAVDRVIVNGKLLIADEEKVVVLLNKPRGYVSTLKDPQGRPRVVDLVADLPQRLYPVGRLDYNTEGLLLLTNDGDLALRLMHPRHHVEKTYLVKVRGAVTDLVKARLENGLQLEDGPALPAKVDHIRNRTSTSWFELTIREGRNRQVRRMCDAVGLSVVRLKRVRIAFLELGNLPTGSYRLLQEEEVERLKTC